MGANAVAGWMDKAFQNWANIPDENEQRLDALEQLLLKQLQTDEQLLKGMVYLIHETQVCRVAIAGLEQRQDQQFRELINEIQRLSDKIDQLIEQEDEGGWFEQLKGWIVSNQRNVVSRRRRSQDLQGISDEVSEPAVEQEYGQPIGRTSTRSASKPVPNAHVKKRTTDSVRQGNKWRD